MQTVRTNEHVYCYDTHLSKAYNKMHYNGNVLCSGTFYDASARLHGTTPGGQECSPNNTHCSKFSAQSSRRACVGMPSSHTSTSQTQSGNTSAETHNWNQSHQICPTSQAKLIVYKGGCCCPAVRTLPTAQKALQAKHHKIQGDTDSTAARQYRELDWCKHSLSRCACQGMTAWAA